MTQTTEVPTSGIPMILTNIYGREDRYLFLAEEGDAGVARDGHGNFQALKRDSAGDWRCVKVPTADYSRAWKWAYKA